MKEYLTDEELNCLITEIEKNELIAAPPDMMEQILEVIAAEPDLMKPKDKKRILEEKVIEFRKYCFRVVTSAAAAVFMVFMLPKLISLQEPEFPLPEILVKQEIVLQEKYDAKAEVLREDGFLNKLFSSGNLFTNENVFNFFNVDMEDDDYETKKE